MSSADSAAPSIAHFKYPTPLDVANATVLITGGSSGIGLGSDTRTGGAVTCDDYVKTFLAAGARQVVIAGRRLDALQAVARAHERVSCVQGDVGNAASREKLVSEVTRRFPDLNVVILNAGIQRQKDSLALTVDAQPPWSERQEEIDINFSSIVHMSTLLVPHLLKQKQATLVTISSGLAFYPAATMAVYAATKAAVHSYTMSLRWQLSATQVRVVEIAPPAVKSNLGGNHDFGEPADEFCQVTFDRLVAGEAEIGYKMSEEARVASRAQIDAGFLGLAARMGKPLQPKEQQ